MGVGAAELTAGRARPLAVVEVLVLRAVVAACAVPRTQDLSAELVPLPPLWFLPCCPQPPLASPGTAEAGVPTVSAPPRPACHGPRGSRLTPAPRSCPDPLEAGSPLGGLSLSAPGTFHVGVREAVQLLGAEARLVVPCAVGLLGVLELATAHSCVGVVEVAVDSWEDG